MKELLFSLLPSDFEITFYRASGPGGQNVNKRSTACRVRHPASGAVATCQEQRHQGLNKKIAFRKMSETKEFKGWMKLEIARRTGLFKAIEEEIELQMRDVNLRIEIKDENGRWTIE